MYNDKLIIIILLLWSYIILLLWSRYYDDRYDYDCFVFEDRCGVNLVVVAYLKNDRIINKEYNNILLLS